MAIWLVDHPTHQYKEDVKELARKNDLQVIDSRFKDSFDPKLFVDEKDAPKLTKLKAK